MSTILSLIWMGITIGIMAVGVIIGIVVCLPAIAFILFCLAMLLLGTFLAVKEFGEWIVKQFKKPKRKMREDFDEWREKQQF